MKILNLYAGIGGNRKLWGDEHEITAVEINPKIAKIYKDFFPNDKMIIADAHKYLLEHYNEFDFIWSSPPCPSHSRLRACNPKQNKPIFPDMKLYEEIIFLRKWFKGKWVVENVKPYYKPLIECVEIQRHCFWANFKIKVIEVKHGVDIEAGIIPDMELKHGVSLKDYKGIDKRKILRNMVNPKIGESILNEIR
ncbi:DNA cytosine methyltransferase [Candidatus Pacearchaeota archaeon]|nr:DNA cytosine methyltransferase [Candidatus Pacearchaeota archaeon]|tara:strand:- start:4602 stop:5183 length:582 start_codon:yes stop_codon:yes gene_type:complete